MNRKKIEIDGIEIDLPAEIAEEIEAARAEGAFHRVALRRRRVNAKGNGEEEFRRYVFRDAAGDLASDWLSDLPKLRDRTGYVRSDDRKGESSAEVPVGTIVVSYDRTYRRGRATGPAEVTVGIVGRDGIYWERELGWSSARTRDGLVVRFGPDAAEEEVQ